MTRDPLPRILIVDDERMVRQMLDRILSGHYEVLTLSSPELVDNAFQTFQPDLIILDVRMPEEDGWHLCNRLRHDKRYDSIPIIFLSGMTDELSVREGFSNGGDYCLGKPFEAGELKQMIQTFIGRKHRHPDEAAC